MDAVIKKMIESLQERSRDNVSLLRNICLVQQYWWQQIPELAREARKHGRIYYGANNLEVVANTKRWVVDVYHPHAVVDCETGELLGTDFDLACLVFKPSHLDAEAIAKELARRVE